MFERFTERARQVVVLAQEEARTLKHNYIGTEHILLGLLREEEGLAARVLESLDITVERVRAQVVRIVGSGEEVTSGQIPFTPRAKKVLELALREALSLGHNYIGTEHILLGLVRENEGVAARILLDFSADAEKIRNEITRMLSGAGRRQGAAGGAPGGEKSKSSKLLDQFGRNLTKQSSEGKLDPVVGRQTEIERLMQILSRRTKNNPVLIGEPGVGKTAVVEGLAARIATNQVPELLKNKQIYTLDLAALADRYIQDRHLPDKAIDLIDEAASRMRIRSMSAPPRYRELEEEIERVRKDKENSIEAQEFEKAASLRDKERKLTQKKRELEEQWQSSETEEQPEIGEEEIADVVSMWTGIPVFKLTEAETAKLVGMEDELHKRVIGQHEAIVAVSKSIRRARAGIKDPKRPNGSFIFLGPSGVGKTELARTLAEFLFADEDAMIQVDMSEYMEKHSVSRLVGSPPGYIGYDEGGQLTEAVRRKPYSVLLLDEIEKAHPDVFNILLQILEEGKLTDAQGRRVDFRNTIVIMTSNLGAAQISKNTGFGFTVGDESGLSYEEMKGRVMGELKKVFRPELLNRIDEIIVFHKLSKEEITTIVDLLLRRLREQMATHEVSSELTDEARELLVDKGYDPAMGARPLRRAIQREIEDPLADFVLGRELEPGSTILVGRTRNDDGEPGDEVDITFIPGEVTPEKVTVPPEEPAATTDDAEEPAVEDE